MVFGRMEVGTRISYLEWCMSQPTAESDFHSARLVGSKKSHPAFCISRLRVLPMGHWNPGRSTIWSRPANATFVLLFLLRPFVMRASYSLFAARQRYQTQCRAADACAAPGLGHPASRSPSSFAGMAMLVFCVVMSANSLSMGRQVERELRKPREWMVVRSCLLRLPAWSSPPLPIGSAERLHS